MISTRDTMIAVLRCVRTQQATLIDHVTSIGALLDYADAHDPGFRAHLKKYEQSDRAVSGLIAELAQMNQVFDEVIQRLESGEEMKL